MKKIIISVSLFITAIAFAAIFVFVILPAYYNKPAITFTVEYRAEENGSLEGNTSQNVELAKKATPVTAIPNYGYKFVKWSDGVTDNPRVDKDITMNIDVTAEFEMITKSFILKDANATSFLTKKEITLSYFDTTLPVHQRVNSVFDGWYLEKDYKTQSYNIRVSDKDGTIVIDNATLINNNSPNLYAKFSLIEEAKYNILMVYTTKVDAEFKLRPDSYQYSYGQDGIREIKYTMPEIEKQICHLLTAYLEDLLNAMFAGLVEFNVDEYFTVLPVTEDCFDYSLYSIVGYDYSLNAYNIPEIPEDMLSNYQSVLTTVDLGDKDYAVLHIAAGCAHAKYGCIYWDRCIGIYRHSGNENFEWLTNPEAPAYEESWLVLLENYIHELTHTIEMQTCVLAKMPYTYHDVLSFYDSETSFKLFGRFEDLGIAYLYLLRQMEYNGKVYGLPYDFWLGKRGEEIWESDR